MMWSKIGATASIIISSKKRGEKSKTSYTENEACNRETLVPSSIVKLVELLVWNGLEQYLAHNTKDIYCCYND